MMRWLADVQRSGKKHEDLRDERTGLVECYLKSSDTRTCVRIRHHQVIEFTGKSGEEVLNIGGHQ